MEPAFRGYASFLAAQALRHKNVTYLNISPAPNTKPIVEAQGYTKYGDGLFVAIPASQWRRVAFRGVDRAARSTARRAA